MQTDHGFWKEKNRKTHSRGVGDLKKKKTKDQTKKKKNALFSKE